MQSLSKYSGVVSGAATILAAIAVALSVSGCAETPGDSVTPEVPRPKVVMSPCADAGPRSELRCGRLPVPEEYARPELRRIDLNIVVAPARNRAEEPLAVFVLEGGPGAPATAGADFFLEEGAAYREQHDVVMVDLRGTGASNPLYCAPLERHGVPLQRHLDEMYPPSEVTECRSSLESRADLRQYVTSNAVEDLEMVRRALEYSKVDLHATSYGTRLATEYIRRYPEQVRTLTAIGSLPPEHRMPLHHAAGFQRAFDLLLSDCEAQVACRQAFPDLRNRWNLLLGRLAQPLAYHYESADLEDGISLTIRRDVFVEKLRSAMYFATGARSLPRVVDAASRDDFAPFLELALPADPDLPPFIAAGAYLSFTCTDDVSRIAAGDVFSFTGDTWLGDYRVAQQMRACKLWPSGSYPVALVSPVESSVPALLITGDRDPVTPPSDARRMAQGLSNARVVIVPHAGHMPFDLSDPECIDRIMLAFLQSATVEDLDLTCIDALEPPPFVLN